MREADEACFAVVGAQAAMDNAAESNSRCNVEAEPAPGITMRARGVVTSSGGIRVIAVSGDVTILAGCCHADDPSKKQELYQITQWVTQRVAPAGTEAIPHNSKSTPEIVNGGSGIHYAWMQTTGMSVEELLRCEILMDDALRCPHEHKPEEAPYWEEGDSDISIDWSGR